MKTLVYENGLRAQSCEGYVRESGAAAHFDRLIILPIPSSRDGVHITGSNIDICDTLEGAGSDTLVLGYGIPEAAALAARCGGCTLCDSATDEVFLLENARLTALGCIGVLLGGGEVSPSELSVGVVGYGRIGRELVRLLLLLGARVRVFTSRMSVCLELGGMGVDATLGASAEGISGLDILINTAPADLFSEVPSELLSGISVMELASGENFPGVEGVRRYPALPLRMFPVSAGRAWGRSAIRLLGGCKNG